MKKLVKVVVVAIVIYAIYCCYFAFSAHRAAAALMRDFEPDLSLALQGQILTQHREAKQPSGNGNRPPADFIWEHALAKGTGVAVYVSSGSHADRARTHIKLFPIDKPSSYPFIESVLYSLHQKVVDFVEAREGPVETEIEAFYNPGDSGPSYNVDMRTSRWKSDRCEVEIILHVTDGPPDHPWCEDKLRVFIRCTPDKAGES